MKKVALILPLIVVLAACGKGTSSSSSSVGPPPTPPAGTPKPVLGQWAIVTQSNVMPGQSTISNFDLASEVVSVNGYQFGVSGTPPDNSEGTPIPAAITPNGSFGWSFPQCLPLGTVNSTQNCPTVDISGFVGVGTPNGVNVTITGISSNVLLEETAFIGTMSSDGSSMTGTYMATSFNSQGQGTQTDSGSFFATVLTASSVAGNYVGTVAIEACNAAGSNCTPAQNVNLSLGYTGTLGAAAGSLQFSFQGNPFPATLATPTTKTIIGGVFNVGLTTSGGTGMGSFDFIPGVAFSTPPVANPASNSLLVNFTIPNGGGTLAIRGFLTPGNVLPGTTPSIGATSSFTYNAGVIMQAPLITFNPVIPLASATFCANGCSQTGFVATPVSLSITITRPVTQGSLRVFVLDASAPASAACPPSNQIAACSFMNYPGNGIYIGDFNPGGGFTLQGVIPGGNSIGPTDNLEVVIIDPTGSWTGAVSWQLNY